MTTPQTPLAPAPTSTAYRPSPRTVVASLWLFVILNYIYCDVMGLMYGPDLAGYLAGDVGGLEITQGFLLVAAILMTVPMASVLISRIAPHRFARWESVVAGALMTVVQAGSLSLGTAPTLHYWYFSVIEVSTTVAIVWVAARKWTVDR